MAERYISSSNDDDDAQKDPELKLEVGNVLKQLNSGNGFSVDKWHDLGLVLKVPEKELKIFEMKYTIDVRRRLTDVIQYWIDNNEATWEELWEALCHSTVSHGKLGREIKNWYWEKTWKDPRRGPGKKIPRRIYIQMPGRGKRLNAVECNFHDTGFSPPVNPKPSPQKYFRIESLSHAQLQRSYRIYQGHMKPELTSYFSELIERDQKKFKTGYEARFGQLYWIECEEKQLQKEGDINYYRDTRSRAFSTHVKSTCDIAKLTRAKCHPPKNDHLAWLIDPLKFEVELPQYQDNVFVAAISDLKENGFQLHEVYQRKKNKEKPLNTSFDFVQPGREYDFRIADCCALLTRMDDVKVRQIADDITRSIHRGSDGSLSMQLVGKDYHVTFFRQKRQQIHQWRGKEKEKWYLAEFDVDTFEMSDAKLKACRREFSGVNEPRQDRWSIEFNGGHRKEIELWSRKIFPERYSSSHPMARLYIDPEATGEVRMPGTPEKPATTWTTAELMKDFDEFVQAAREITEILES